MRGVATVVGGVLLVALLAVGLALSAALAARHAAVVQRAAVEALESSSLRAVLEPLDRDCGDGFVKARFRLLSSAPWAEELVVYGLDGSKKVVRLEGGEAVLDIPCGRDVVLVVRGRGREWVYRFEQDPYNPCLTGCRVSGERLLRGRDCLAPSSSLQAPPEELAREAARKVLGLVFGQSLTPVAVVAWGDGLSVVREGLRPGVNAKVVGVFPLEGKAAASSRLQGSVKVDIRGPYTARYEGTERVELYSYRVGGLEVGRARLGLLVEAFRASFRVDYWGSVPGYSDYVWKASVRMEPPLLRADYFNDSGPWCNIYGACWQYNITGYVEEAGAAAYVLVPFLVSREAEPFTVLVSLVPLGEARLDERYYEYVEYCPWYCERYVKRDLHHEQLLEVEQRARVVVYVLDPRRYSWDMVVVERPEGVPGGWASRIAVPLKAVTVWEGLLDKPVAVRVVVDPSKLFQGLPRSFEVAIAAVTVILGGSGVEALEDPASWASPWSTDAGWIGVERVHLYKVNGVRALVYFYRLGEVGGGGGLHLVPPGLSASGAKVVGEVSLLEPWNPKTLRAGGTSLWGPDYYHGQYWTATLRVYAEAPYKVVEGAVEYEYEAPSGGGGGYINATHLVAGGRCYRLDRVEVSALPTLLDEYAAKGREVLVEVWPRGT